MKNVDVGWGPIGLNEIRRKNTKLKLSNSYLELELNSSYKIEINSAVRKRRTDSFME